MSSEAAARAKRGSMLTTPGTLPRNAHRSAGGSPAGPPPARRRYATCRRAAGATELRKVDLGDLGEAEVLVLPGRFFAADEIDFGTRAAIFEIDLQFGA